MGWELFVSTRYLVARRRERLISLISLISVVGIAVGVAALIVVISVMSGFDRDLRDKIIGINSHIVIEDEYGISDPDAVLARLRGIEGVVSSARYVHGQVMVRSRDNVVGIMVRGVEPNEVRVTKIGSYLTSGSLDFGVGGIVIGSELASKLNVKLKDTVTIISPVYTRGHELTVTGIFTSGMYEYDANLAYASLKEAEDLFGLQGVVSGIAVRVDDAFRADYVKAALRKSLEGKYVVRTWMDSNKNLMGALKLEKTVMFLILTLIVMVACFNIASTLIMMVLEKTKDIGILKAIGATGASVTRIFAVTGGLIGLAGTAVGTLLGITACWLLKTYKFISLPKDIYYVDRLPVNMAWQEIGIIIASSLALSLLATVYPSFQASRLDPVEALRYE